MPQKRMPAILADRAVWESNYAKRELWDGVIEKVRKGVYRRKPRRDAVHKEVRGVQDRCERKVYRK